jgi:hypothetical protein
VSTPLAGPFTRHREEPVIVTDVMSGTAMTSVESSATCAVHRVTTDSLRRRGRLLKDPTSPRALPGRPSGARASGSRGHLGGRSRRLARSSLEGHAAVHGRRIQAPRRLGRRRGTPRSARSAKSGRQQPGRGVPEGGLRTTWPDSCSTVCAGPLLAGRPPSAGPHDGAEREDPLLQRLLAHGDVPSSPWTVLGSVRPR